MENLFDIDIFAESKKEDKKASPEGGEKSIPVPTSKEIPASAYNQVIADLQKTFKEGTEVMEKLQTLHPVQGEIDESVDEADELDTILESIEPLDEGAKQKIKDIIKKTKDKLSKNKKRKSDEDKSDSDEDKKEDNKKEDKKDK